ncbi:hypothetical protein [Solitalea koreensis]|nr:hypothetical protein [Solitalea koreensis]
MKDISKKIESFREKNSIVLQLIGIAVIVGAFIIMVLINEERFKRRTEISNAVIVKIGSTNRGELTLDYEFRLQDRLYKGGGVYSVISINSSDFRGRSFPVIYEKNKPENNGLLLAPSDLQNTIFLIQIVYNG